MMSKDWQPVWNDVKSDIKHNILPNIDKNYPHPFDVYVRIVHILYDILRMKGIKPSLENLTRIIDERNEMGYQKYGKYLTPFNGRDALQDALEEVLDLVVYFKQHLIEENQKGHGLK